jgi:predicted nucleic acid-binding protein
MVVIDPSVIVPLALTDEDREPALKVLDAVQSEGATVPALFWFEARNILIVAERRGRITPADTSAFLTDLSALQVAVDRVPDESVHLALARDQRLTVYDASYLELALRLNAPLATLDRALVAAANAMGAKLLLDS